jgi:hypothetical protein
MTDLDRKVANAMGLKSVNNCEKWGKDMNDKTYQQITSRMAEISKKHKLPSTVSQMWTVLFKHQGANMTEEDEAFNEIERRAKQRMEAVRAAMRGEDDDIQEYKKPWVGLTYEEESELIRLAHNHAGIRFYIQAAEAKLKEKNT